MPQLDPDNLPDDYDFDDDGNIIDADGKVVADAEGTPVAPTEDKTIKKVRAAASRAAAERDAAKRELAFLKAGVDTDTPIGKLFSTAYEGPLDPDAVKKAFAEVAPGPTGDPVVDPEAESTTGEPTEDERRQQAEREGLATGAEQQTGVAPVRPVRDTTLEAAQSAFEQGASRDDAIAGFINARANAAMDGDQSVLVQDQELQPSP